jgi:protein-tyrosine phosphatase
MTKGKKTIRISFVCLGNICRSPTAEAVMRKLVASEGLKAAIEIDSAGTGDWHVGHTRDTRSQAVGKRRGTPLGGFARQFQPGDFALFDYVLAMDRSNRDDLLAMAPDLAGRAKVHLFRSFDPNSPKEAEVPDPYYGGPDGFDRVFDICEAACRGLLAHLVSTHNLGR